MAGRGRASSQKRQKEMARLEKRQQKAQRKQERKLGIRSDSSQEDENAGLGLESEGDNADSADNADNAGSAPELG